jgi:predicted membrane protein
MLLLIILLMLFLLLFVVRGKKIKDPLIWTLLLLPIILISIKVPFSIILIPVILITYFLYQVLTNTDKKTKNITNNMMTMGEAIDILGVSQSYTKDEVEKMFRNKMKANHPDVGGSRYFAEKLIQAREFLLKHLGRK